MPYRYPIRARTGLLLCTLAFYVLSPLLSPNAAHGAESSEVLLLQIIDAHQRLATNDVFVAQAKMLGAYLEAAGPLDDTAKQSIYTKVLDILKSIEISQSQASEVRSESDEGSNQRESRKTLGTGSSRYEPGGAILEVFRSDSIEMVPDLPIVRTYWDRDLVHAGKSCILPDRAAEIGLRLPYVAKFSFYFEAKRPGQYGFTLVDLVNQKGRSSIWSTDRRAIAQKLVVSGVDAVTIRREPTAQGVCNLKKGFYLIEFWFTDHVDPSPKTYHEPRGFEVRVLTPDAFDAVPISAQMMLLKK